MNCSAKTPAVAPDVITAEPYQQVADYLADYLALLTLQVHREVLLLRAVREVLDGGVPTPVRSATSPVRPAGNKTPAERFGLTTAQARVLELLAGGRSNREIAELLGLTEGTVKVHMTAIYRALGVSSRSQALVAIARSGARL